MVNKCNTQTFPTHLALIVFVLLAPVVGSVQLECVHLITVVEVPDLDRNGAILKLRTRTGYWLYRTNLDV